MKTELNVTGNGWVIISPKTGMVISVESHESAARKHAQFMSAFPGQFVVKRAKSAIFELED